MHPAIELHEAFVRGDLEAVKSLLGNTPDFPNGLGPRGVGEIVLEDAIYWSPFPFVRTLLDLGANPNYDDQRGFPSLIAALSTGRADKLEIIDLLIQSGASVHQRGVNDYTPLHYAASLDDPAAVELLLARGADPDARTTIDDYETPLELADRYGKRAAALVLRNIRAR